VDWLQWNVMLLYALVRTELGLNNVFRT
jgi:hypothetical protein